MDTMGTNAQRKARRATKPLDDPASVRPAVADAKERHPRGEERRALILRTAVAMLAEKGYRGTRIAEIAERVGMTHPGLLYYFGSKERLLYEVVKERVAHEQATLAESFSPENASLTRLGEIARANLDATVFIRLYLVLAVESFDADAPLHDYFVNRFRFTREEARLTLTNDIRHGLLRPDIDIDALSFEMTSFWLGLDLQWFLDPDCVDYVEAVESFANRLLTTYGPNPS